MEAKAVLNVEDGHFEINIVEDVEDQTHRLI